VPILSLASAIVRLADRDFDVEIPTKSTSLEIGRMRQAVLVPPPLRFQPTSPTSTHWLAEPVKWLSKFKALLMR
jgi:hypothetical protein